MQNGVTPKVWSEADVNLHIPRALTALRVFALLWWKKKLRREFESYVGTKWSGSRKKFKVKLNCVMENGRASYSWDCD